MDEQNETSVKFSFKRAQFTDYDGQQLFALNGGVLEYWK